MWQDCIERHRRTQQIAARPGGQAAHTRQGEEEKLNEQRRARVGCGGRDIVDPRDWQLPEWLEPRRPEKEQSQILPGFGVLSRSSVFTCEWWEVAEELDSVSVVPGTWWPSKVFIRWKDVSFSTLGPFQIPSNLRSPTRYLAIFRRATIGRSDSFREKFSQVPGLRLLLPGLRELWLQHGCWQVWGGWIHLWLRLLFLRERHSSLKIGSLWKRALTKEIWVNWKTEALWVGGGFLL